MGKAGFAFAVEELPLVFFTALAPMGIVCMVVLFALILSGRFEKEESLRLNQLAWVPLSVTTVGLIASAAHLGTPANALYVFSGVGRSPLSTEVFFCVFFLAVCGFNWLYSFVRTDKLALKRIIAAVIVASGVVALWCIAVAYDVDTIRSWHTVFVPANLVLGGLMGGLLLAAFTLALGTQQSSCLRLRRALAAAAGIALLVHLVCIGLQWAQLQNMTGAYGTAADFAPLYPLFASMYAVLAAAGVGITFFAGRFKNGRAAACLAVLLTAGGLVLVRFGFYMMHMTVGLA